VQAIRSYISRQIVHDRFKGMDMRYSRWVRDSRNRLYRAEGLLV
jgi:hypothetical protein